jgi:Protein of unknown function (DUF4240)
MNDDAFWSIIRAARDGESGDFEGRPRRLADLLRRQSPQDVASFIEHFHDAMDVAYSYDLWGAAFVIGGGCSDDSFMDFRKWLISCGRELHESAIADPESLADVSFGQNAEHDAFFEEYSIMIAVDVYVALTGKDPPPRRHDAPREPGGRDWDEDDLPKRYPRLWKRWSHRAG